MPPPRIATEDIFRNNNKQKKKTYKKLGGIKYD
jgi:hypothetical protein